MDSMREATLIKLQLQAPRFLPLPRRRASPPALAFHSQCKLPDVDTDAAQEWVRSWLSRARGAIADAARERGRHKEEAEGRKEQRKEALEEQALVALPEITVDRRVGRGWLSLDAVVAIEQFARLNWLTGRKVQRIFKALAPEHVHSDARNLELAFQRLIFVTMLAWEDPYDENNDPHSTLDNYFVLVLLIFQQLIISLGPLLALKRLSLDLWTTYLGEFLKVRHGRQTHKTGDNCLSDEQVLCIGSSRKRPILKWEEITAWPGHFNQQGTLF